jgi:hypothetical protein
VNFFFFGEVQDHAQGGFGARLAGARDAAADEGGAVDPEKARGLLNQADKALKKKKFDPARDLAKQAEPFANAPLRDEIRDLNDRIDRAEAKAAAAEIMSEADGGKCGKALDDTAAVIAARGKGQAFPRFVRELTRESNVKCLLTMVAAPEKLREVRMLADTTSAQEALGKKAYDELKAQLREAVVATVMKAAETPLTERRWSDALGELRKAIERGDAGADDLAAAMEVIHKGVAEDLRKIHSEALAKAALASEGLKKFDALVAVAFAPANEGEAPKSGQPKGLRLPPAPKELTDLRAQLAFWVACSAVRCQDAAPKKVWAFGNVPLVPPLDPKGKASETLRHGTQMWQIATGQGFVLVAKADPGQLQGIAARAEPAWGWLPANAVRDNDTTEWLPPGDSLVSTRVWAPLREKDKDPLYEIGTVVALEAGQIKVRRMSDRAEMTIARGKLRFGVVKAGMRVLAMCGGSVKLKPGLVESVRETKYEAQGDPQVKLSCVDDNDKPTGEKREELLGTLRVKPEWLPKPM